jgi:hypothetical protein
MAGDVGYQEVFSLTLTELGKLHNGEGQFEGLADAVIQAAKHAGLIPPGADSDWRNTSTRRNRDETRVAELVREALWDCLIKRLVVLGMNSANSSWPFFRLTEHGSRCVRDLAPQPYDPNGFMRYFDAKCKGVDPAVRSYLEEAVQAFNSGCTRSAAVMLGCASEKLILLLCDAFEAAISDPDKKARFTKALNTRWTISHKYETLHAQLGEVIAAKKLPRDLIDTVSSELPAGFELLRRCRNAAGHPEVVGDVSSDTVFLNIRTFTEYARQVSAMLSHFATNTVSW